MVKHMKQILSLVAFLTISLVSFSQDHTIRGFVFNNENSEVIPFEKIVLIPTEKTQDILGASTDVNGFFTIPKVPIGTYLLKIQSVEFKEYNKEVKVTEKGGITELRIDIIPIDATDVGEVVISAETKAKTTEVLMSVTKLDKKGLERIPAVGAENDITAAFSVTPGVVTTGDQGGQLYVRGGTPIQNKVLLDGMTIYNPFNSNGGFCIFET